MGLKLADNAVSTLAGAISNSATTLAVAPGDGAKYPVLGAGDWFPLTLVKSDGTLEIVRCTARAADTFTIVRAQEGTAALAFSVGDHVDLRLTVGALGEFMQQSGATMTGTLKMIGDGVTTPSKTLKVSAGVFDIMNDAGTTAILTLDDSGNLVALGDNTSTSDERLKADWEAPPKNFVARLAHVVLRGSYTRTDTGQRQVGVSAQAMRRLLPFATRKDKNGIWSLAYGQAAMVSAIELAIELEALKARVKALEKQAGKKAG